MTTGCDVDAPQPSGHIGPRAGRDTSGRFTPGNGEALVVGERSFQFWREHDAARRELVAAVVADAGHTLETAPRALRLAADGLAQAALVRESAFARLVESGGPLTVSGRSRRIFAVWLAACDRAERHLRLVGLQRVPRPAPTLADYPAGRSRMNEAGEVSS